MSKLKKLAEARAGGAQKLAKDLAISEGHLSHILKHNRGVSVPLARRLLRIFPSLTLDDLPPKSDIASKAKKHSKSVCVDAA